MSLRNVVVPNVAPDTTLKMQRILITDSSIMTLWRAVTPGQATKDDIEVEVTAATLATIQAKASFQNLLDTIANDTSPRVLTP